MRWRAARNELKCGFINSGPRTSLFEIRRGLLAVMLTREGTTMAEKENTQVVKDAYAAFQRGDVAAIVNSCDENVEWHGVIGTEGVLPQSGRRRGRAEVAEFFKQVAETTDFTSFEPKEFVAQADKVVALGSYSARLKPSGQTYASDWVMVFTVRNGKVTGFQEFSDSAQLVRAYKGLAAGV